MCASTCACPHYRQTLWIRFQVRTSLTSSEAPRVKALQSALWPHLTPLIHNKLPGPLGLRPQPDFSSSLPGRRGLSVCLGDEGGLRGSDVSQPGKSLSHCAGPGWGPSVFSGPSGLLTVQPRPVSNCLAPDSLSALLSLAADPEGTSLYESPGWITRLFRLLLPVLTPHPLSGLTSRGLLC